MKVFDSAIQELKYVKERLEAWRDSEHIWENQAKDAESAKAHHNARANYDSLISHIDYVLSHQGKDFAHVYTSNYRMGER